MTCTDCTTAAERPWHGFHAGCPGCCARSAARSPQYCAARKAGMQDRRYRALLEQLGTDHASVLAAADVDVFLTPRKVRP